MGIDETAFQQMLGEVWKHPFPDREAICRSIVEVYEAAKASEEHCSKHMVRAELHCPLCDSEAVEQPDESTAIELLTAMLTAYHQQTGKVSEYGGMKAVLRVLAPHLIKRESAQTDEKPLHIITKTGCSICGTDALNCGFWKTYRKPERESSVLITDLMACVHHPSPTNPIMWNVKPQHGREFSRVIEALSKIEVPSSEGK